MANTFSATDLNNTKATVQSILSTIEADIHSLSDTTSRISSLVAQGSGGLAGSWSNISSTYKEIGNSVQNSTESFINELMKYYEQTVENETEGSSKLEAINTALDDIKTRLSSL